MKKLILFLLVAPAATAKEIKKQNLGRNNLLINQESSLSRFESRLSAIDRSCCSWQQKLKELNQLEEESLRDSTVFYPRLLSGIALIRLQLTRSYVICRLESCRQEASRFYFFPNR